LEGFDLKVLVRTLVMPPALPLMLLMAGLLLLAWGSRRAGQVRSWAAEPRSSALQRLGLRLAGLGLGLAYLLSIGATADLLGAWLERGQYRFEVGNTSVQGNPGALVVLGGGTVRDGVGAPDRERLKEGTLQRVVEGARIARASGLPVLVSGGTPLGLKRPEAHVMRDTLEQLGTRVRWVEDQSRDTAENARMSVAILHEAGVSNIILITHAYHMPRARLTFEGVGLVVNPAPHDFMGGHWREWKARDFLPRAQDAELIALCLHELLGRLWYQWRGHLGV